MGGEEERIKLQKSILNAFGIDKAKKQQAVQKEVKSTVDAQAHENLKKAQEPGFFESLRSSFGGGLIQGKPTGKTELIQGKPTGKTELVKKKN